MPLIYSFLLLLGTFSCQPTDRVSNHHESSHETPVSDTNMEPQQILTVQAEKCELIVNESEVRLKVEWKFTNQSSKKVFLLQVAPIYFNIATPTQIDHSFDEGPSDLQFSYNQEREFRVATILPKADFRWEMSYILPKEAEGKRIQGRFFWFDQPVPEELIQTQNAKKLSEIQKELKSEAFNCSVSD